MARLRSTRRSTWDDSVSSICARRQTSEAPTIWDGCRSVRSHKVREARRLGIAGGSAQYAHLTMRRVQSSITTSTSTCGGWPIRTETDPDSTAILRIRTVSTTTPRRLVSAGTEPPACVAPRPCRWECKARVICCAIHGPAILPLDQRSMQAQSVDGLKTIAETDQPARADEDRTQTGDTRSAAREIGRALSTTIEDEQLDLDEHGLGHDRAAAATGES